MDHDAFWAKMGPPPAPALMGKLALRAKARAMQASVRPSELAYTLALQGIFKGLHTSMVETLLRDYAKNHRALPSGALDANDKTYGLDLRAIEVHFLTQVPAKVVAAFDKTAPGLIKATARTHTLLSLHPIEMGIESDVAMARDANIRLVERAGRDYADDVRAVFEDPANADLSTDALRDLLVERGNASVSRADLIARDQVLKLAAAMNRTRQMNSGVTEYEWSGCLDRRERATHLAMEERRCSWLVRPKPLGYHPGEDYQCRCVAIAYVPELDGL